MARSPPADSQLLGRDARRTGRAGKVVRRTRPPVNRVQMAKLAQPSGAARPGAGQIASNFWPLTDLAKPYSASLIFGQLRSRFMLFSQR